MCLGIEQNIRKIYKENIINHEYIAIIVKARA